MKSSSVYVCQNCGFEAPKWQGQCPSCQNWNSLVETTISIRSSSKSQFSKPISSKPLKLDQVESLQFSRGATGISELDRVLGGGIVPGSVVLLAGEPGMGKSTLLTQLALKIQNTVLYVCGEESPSQVKLRIQRLDNNIKDSQLFLLPETNVETIVENAGKGLKNVKLMIIDSIQTLWTQRLSGMAGSVGQIRESANILTEFAKKNNIPVFLVGHVTKEGEIAGPKILEHLVDTVLYLEGERYAEYRILRAVKNRFGPTDEVGIFSMGQKGMEEILNPAKIFLESDAKDKRTKNERIGSATVVTMQGTRPILVEIQALCVSSPIPVPRRVARGIDANRLQILCAVLQKKAGIPLYNQDVFLSVAGGLKVSEPGIDFGICMAIISSYKNKTLTEKTAVIGEVGLLGEIRSIAFLDKRKKQAKALGYTNILGPDKYRNLASALADLT